MTIGGLGTVTPAATMTGRPQVSGVSQQVLLRKGLRARRGDDAQPENARLTLQCFRALLQQDSIARQEADTQAALVKQLEAAVTLHRAVDAGNVVRPGDANDLAVVTQRDPIDVEFSVPQDRVPELQAQAGAAAAMPWGGHPDGGGACESALRERRSDAVSEPPLGQRAAAAAHRRGRGGVAPARAAPRRPGRIRPRCVQLRQVPQLPAARRSLRSA